MIIVLGSSPNGLVAALALKRRGLDVQVVEPGEVGGPTVPSSRIDPQVASELGLPVGEVHSGRICDGLRVTRDGLEGAPARDQERWPAFVRLLDDAAGLLRQLYRSPASVTESWRSLGRRQSMEVLRLPWMSIRDLVQEWFEDPRLQGALASLAVRGLKQGPFGAGTVFPLIHHWATGDALEWGHFPLEAILREVPVKKVEVRSIAIEDGRVVGLDTAEGRLAADVVLCDDDLRQTFTRWVNPRELETEFNREVARFRFGGCMAHFRFEGIALPGLTCVAPSVNYVEKAFDSTKADRPPGEPVLELHPDGRGWAQFSGQAEAAAAVEKLGGRIVSWEGPAELASRYRLTEGHLFGGETLLHQAFFMRPACTTPVCGLYLCGATTHPGGYSGLSGWLAAQAVEVRDGTTLSAV